jgi:hypothetical protein
MQNITNTLIKFLDKQTAKAEVTQESDEKAEKAENESTSQELVTPVKTEKERKKTVFQLFPYEATKYSQSTLTYTNHLV